MSLLLAALQSGPTLHAHFWAPLALFRSLPPPCQTFDKGPLVRRSNISRLMGTPQMGIFGLGDPSHCFMEFTLNGGAVASDAVQRVADLHDPRKTSEGVNLVVGFRPEVWRSVLPRDTPADAKGFDHDLRGPDGYTMPATQADVLVWIAGAAYDNVFDVGTMVLERLRPDLTLARELAGWTYQRNRDLTGFQDGTENPDLVAAPDVVLIPEGEPGASGSILLLQQWKHDADAWRALAVDAQERVIGRTKSDSTEFPDDRMPANAHVTRTTLVENGEELKIFRRNTPYGGVGDHGTVFVGFAKQQHRLQRMIERMVGIGDGVRDALTRYSVALTGSYYFVPALSTLARLGTPVPDAS
jgi:porphyrinogen peroxidase